MSAITNVVCEKCGRAMEIDAAKEAGWLVAKNLDNEYGERFGELVIRCPEHVDTEALVCAGKGERYERVMGDWSGPHKPRQVAIVWRGKVVDEFSYQPAGHYEDAGGGKGLIGLTPEELKQRGFFRTRMVLI